jgi:hypothetical protein
LKVTVFFLPLSRLLLLLLLTGDTSSPELNDTHSQQNSTERGYKRISYQIGI